MIPVRHALLAGIAVLGMGLAAAQIVPQPGAEPAQPVAPPAAPAADPTAAPQGMTAGVSMGGLKSAFEMLGMNVSVKTTPNGLQYFEARSGGDLIYGSTVLCASASQTDCKKVVLETGYMDRAVSYEELTRFNTSGFASRVVTYNIKKKQPSLALIVDLHGAVDGEFLPGQIRGLMSDMQSFLGQLQGRQTTGFSTGGAPPEALIKGNFKGVSSGGPGALQTAQNAN